MKANLLTEKILFVWIVFLITSITHAQLPDFSLSVTPTAQTCLGNGTLNFAVQGASNSASIDYTVYLLPDISTPLTVTTQNSVAGLIAGEYLVVATQSLGGESNTASSNVTIVDNTETLLYALMPTNVHCGNDGAITVSIISGTAASYEIINGPVTFPQQESNVFENLPVGVYQVRVYDDCGDALVVSVSVLQAETGMFIGEGNKSLESCTTAYVQNFFSVPIGSEVFWPLTLTYTIHPPDGGADIVLVENITNPVVIFENIIPYYDETYIYDLEVTDACGNVFSGATNTVFPFTPSWILDSGFDIEGCTPVNIGAAQLVNLIYPVTVEFLNAPPGFIPEEYNVSHPVFNASEGITYYKEGEPLPLGSYTVLITDACGNQSQQIIGVSSPNSMHLQPSPPGDCGKGGVRFCMEGKQAEYYEIQDGPDEFSETYPVLIEGEEQQNGDVDIMNLPPGEYTLYILDSCGYEFNFDYTVIGAPIVPPIIYQLAGCEEGFATIRTDVADTMTSFIIQTAPDSFTEPLPYDASEYIEDGILTISLPGGQYTFLTTTETCPEIAESEISVYGYTIQTNEFEITPSCSSFDLYVEHNSNATFEDFWLQKYNETTGNWEHPLTENEYVEGEELDDSNAQLISNYITNVGFPYTGHFRVLKTFIVYDEENPQSYGNPCIQEIYSFDYDGIPQIINGYTFPCEAGTNDVIIIAEGQAPLSYSITAMNGEPFNLDNGTSNLFLNLESATYNFQVTDVCGNIRNILYNISELSALQIEGESLCEGENGLLSIQPFSFLSYAWYAASDPDTVLSTTNSLSIENFDPDTDSGMYYLQLSAENITSCINNTVLEYEVTANVLPNAGENNSLTLCNDNSDLNLNDYLSDSHDTGGDWIDTDGTGALTNEILDLRNLVEGTYNFTYVVTGCEATDEAIITLTLFETPLPPTISPISPTCEGEDIQLLLTPDTGVTYEWTGPNGFYSTEANPVIENISIATSGVYNVVATSTNGCSSQVSTIEVIVNPSNFTIGGETEVCEGQSTILSLEAEDFNINNADVTWYQDGVELTDVDSQNIEVFETGEYQAVVTNNTCETAKTVYVTLNTNAFEVLLENGCNNFQYILSVANAEEMQGFEFEWTGPDTYNFIGEEANITNLSPGEYSVLVTDINGCSILESVMVENTSCVIPRGISPNDDEYNQYFDLSSLDVQNLEIFNRYGMKVYERENYVKEWYGQSDKGELPSGTYFYVVTLSAGKQVTGWVYLQR